MIYFKPVSNMYQANVHLNDRLICCLADFGLSAIVESKPFHRQSPAFQQSVFWTAPEVMNPARYQEQDPQAGDIYSLACTIYEVNCLKILQDIWVSYVCPSVARFILGHHLSSICTNSRRLPYLLFCLGSGLSYHLPERGQRRKKRCGGLLVAVGRTSHKIDLI